MTDLKLTAAGDIDLTNGRASLVDGDDLIVQRLRINLRFFTGDWFLDLNYGVPYHGRVLIKGVNDADIHQIFQAAIVNTRGVAIAENLEVTIGNADERKITIAATALTDKGTTVTVSEDL